MVGTIRGSMLANLSTGGSSWLSFVPWDVTVISCLTSCCSKSLSMCLYLIYKGQYCLVVPIICQSPKRKEINLQMFLTVYWKLNGQSHRLQFYYRATFMGKSREWMHHVTSIPHLIWFSISGAKKKPIRTSGESRILTGSLCSLSQGGQKNQLLFTETVLNMCFLSAGWIQHWKLN